MVGYLKEPDDAVARRVIGTLASAAQRTQIIGLRARDWIRGKPNGCEWYVINQNQPDASSVAEIHRTAQSPTADPPRVASAVGSDPAGEIKIGDKTIRLTVVENDGEVVYESGEANDISFRELADWAATQFGAEVPEELTSIAIRYLGVDVFTTLQQRTIQFVVAIYFELGGTTVDMMADLVCTRTSSASTDFILRTSTGITLSDDNHLWIDGIVRRASATTSALASTYGNESPE
jgi:hypothetical protein